LLAFRALLFICLSALAKTYLLTSFGLGGGATWQCVWLLALALI